MTTYSPMASATFAAPVRPSWARIWRNVTNRPAIPVAVAQMRAGTAVGAAMSRDWPNARIDMRSGANGESSWFTGEQLFFYMMGLTLGVILPVPIVAGAALGPLVTHIVVTLVRGARRCA